jgi:hypothetical protein
LGKRPVRVRPDAKVISAWRTLIAAKDPEIVCYSAVSLELQTTVLPAVDYDEGEPSHDLRTLARALADPLVRAALSKLARRFPRDGRAPKKWMERLIRYHPDDALAYLTQAVEWTTELLFRDLAAHHHDGVSTRVDRVLDIVSHSPLPSWKGRRSIWIGPTYDLWILRRYEAWSTALAKTFPGREWAETPQDVREQLIVAEQESGDLPDFVETALLQKACAETSRERAALTIVSQSTPATHVSSKYLRTLLQAPRKWARQIDARDG